MKGKHWKKKKTRKTFVSSCAGCGKDYHQYEDKPVRHCAHCLAASQERRIEAGIVVKADGLQY